MAEAAAGINKRAVMAVAAEAAAADPTVLGGLAVLVKASLGPLGARRRVALPTIPVAEAAEPQGLVLP